MVDRFVEKCEIEGRGGFIPDAPVSRVVLGTASQSVPSISLGLFMKAIPRDRAVIAQLRKNRNRAAKVAIFVIVSVMLAYILAMNAILHLK